MKHVIKLAGIAVMVAAILVFTIAGVVSAASGPMGPAPNSGDCIPDGSGFEAPNGPVGDNGAGPAPNSGDGIPDGSGF